MKKLLYKFRRTRKWNIYRLNALGTFQFHLDGSNESFYMGDTLPKRPVYSICRDKTLSPIPGVPHDSIVEVWNTISGARNPPFEMLIPWGGKPLKTIYSKAKSFEEFLDENPEILFKYIL